MQLITEVPEYVCIVLVIIKYIVIYSVLVFDLKKNSLK